MRSQRAMARDDWCRRTTWTAQDQKEFFDRNARSRGDHSKAQYLRIQACTLLDTGQPDLIESALQLLEQSCSDYPNAMDRALALQAAGECCEALGRTEQAIVHYLRALDREREFPGIRSNAAFLLAKIVVEHDRRDLYTKALAAAESYGAPVFPWHAYFLNGLRAAVAQEKGDLSTARAHAKLALEASAIRDTGLSHGRGHLGTVRDTPTVFHSFILKISHA
jgi:tetratricopeptide (TPR) repeat protein